MKRRISILGLSLVVLFGGSGCLALVGSALTSSSQNLPIPNLDVELEDTTKARIYLIRPGQGMYAVTDIPHIFLVIDDGEKRKIGKIKSGKFFSWESSPSNLTISAEQSRSVTRQTPYRPPVEYSFDVVAGKVYYIQLRIDSGFYSMMQISPEEGKELLNKTSPVKSST